MATLIKQNTPAPTRKQNFVALGAVVATMLAAVMAAADVPFFTRLLDYPGFEAAMGGGLAFAFGWFARERLS